MPRGAVGPVEARLLSFPPLRRWVFGAWGEASEDIHSLVHDLASARQKHQHLLDGRRGAWSRVSEKGELAMLTGQIRRSLSLEAVRSQARCLLGRLSGLGAGAASAARRRAWAETDERRMDRERRAYLPHALSTIPNFTINVSKPKYFGFLQKVRNCPLCLGYV